MKTDLNIIKEIVKTENELKIYDRKVFGFSIWRIVRFNMRARLLKIRTGFVKNSKKQNISYFSILKNFFLSAGKLLLSIFSRKKNIANLVFAFPRLQETNQEYIDKFTDPVIEYSDIKNSYLIFQRPNAGNHKKKRSHSKHTIKTDFILITSMVFGYLLFPAVSIIYFSSLFDIYRKTKIYFLFSLRHFIQIGLSLSIFISSFSFYYYLIKILKPKRIFVVDREIFFPVILACKKQNVLVYELQHGITHGATILYSGNYDPMVDPDYFLSFGKAWLGDQFGIPIDRIINIGWAYKKTVTENSNIKKYSPNTVLVISSPEISTNIIKATILLAKEYVDYIFHIRLHPQESLTHNLLDLINTQKNVIVKDNIIESSMAVLSYSYLLGENSSVLYEALSFGKKVGKLNFAGLHPELIKGNRNSGFYNLKKVEDFEDFIKSDSSNFVNSEYFYTNFKADIVNTLI